MVDTPLVFSRLVVVGNLLYSLYKRWPLRGQGTYQLRADGKCSARAVCSVSWQRAATQAALHRWSVVCGTSMSHTLNLDQALVELGQFGRYQRLHFCLLVVPVVYSAIRAGNFIFNAADPGYRCLVPECESSPAQWAPGLWASWALVAGSHCERRAPAAPGGDCLPATFGDATQPCDAWLYANNNTIVYEFDLACQELKRTMVGSTHAFGVFTALFGIGIISDRFGRRATLILTATSCAVAGMTRSFATSYTMYVICEYFDALLGAGVYSTAFVLALEMVGPKMRVLCGSILSCAFAMGQVCLALLAWAVPYWRHLTRIIYGPCFFFIFYYFLVEESIRWLIIKGKKEKATEILLKVAQFNKKHISRETIDRLVNIDPSVTHVGGVKKLSLVCKVLHSRILMQRVLICSFVWITTTFTYYGLSINSVSLAGNMYINYILTSLVEIPGYIVSVYVLDRFGRKVPIIVSLFFCGASLFMLPIISSSLSGLQLAVTLAGKLGASSAASNMHVYTTELFPTGTRHRALTACSTVARLGQAAAMLTPLLMGVNMYLPYLMFGAFSVTAGLLLLLTPETHRRLLPDTVEQAEKLDSASAPRLAPSTPPPPPPPPLDLDHKEKLPD
ncbi:organic cation transporter protein-like [Pectinophora gossypiella]|uniref:organic cation transporter protein-like n=1 Tax=Pectinophora gossypiella TaxID=13191 RepID=UPI00214E5DB2|nr:organic cation transporter protein-like [Pectinophora gossypiella]